MECRHNKLQENQMKYRHTGNGPSRLLYRSLIGPLMLSYTMSSSLYLCALLNYGGTPVSQKHDCSVLREAVWFLWARCQRPTPCCNSIHREWLRGVKPSHHRNRFIMAASHGPKRSHKSNFGKLHAFAFGLGSKLRRVCWMLKRCWQAQRPRCPFNGW